MNLKPTNTMNKLENYIKKHLPKRATATGGYRITFTAKLGKDKWNISVQNDTNSKKNIAIAIKGGTKGATDTTRKEFDFTVDDLGFVAISTQPHTTKL